MSLVTTSPLVKRYTLEEFWELDSPERGGHYELIAGVLYMIPPPTEWHDLTVSRLTELLMVFLHNHPRLGRAFVPRAAIWREAHHSYLEPDLMFVSEGTQARIRGGARFMADLVFEVLSEATATYDRLTKADT
jgi:Uma2 family endonuclease